MDAIERLLRSARPTVPKTLRESVEGTSLVSGRIRVLHRIGGGAIGTVYEALDRGDRVALKVLNELNPQQIYRLKQEFRRLIDFDHPNVVSVYELFGTESDWFFTMEIVQGCPLDQYWALDTTLGDRVDGLRLTGARELLLRNLLRQLIEGVAAVHRAGLLHRDLKPSNVLVEPEGRVVILDFGLVSDQLPGGFGQTVEHAISGTPAYMAPEQAIGEPATPATDWYAVGVILYQLITGRLPHTGLTSRELLRNKRLTTPVPVSSLAPDTPADLVELCTALLHGEPGSRPTAATLLNAARGWASISNPSLSRDSSTALSALSVESSTHPEEPAQPWIGSADILDRVEAAFRRTRTGGPGLVLLEGTSGVGKTTVLKQAVERLRRGETAFVLEGRCYYRENVPYKGFDGVIDHLSRILRLLPKEQSLQLIPRHVPALLRLFPVLRRVEILKQEAQRLHESADGIELQQQGLEALRELFARIADRRALVLVIDDLQWGDADTIRLLASMLAPPNPPRMLIIASHRGGEADDDWLAKDLLAIPNLHHTRVELPVLSHANAARLAASVLAGVDDVDRIADVIARDAAGIPFYVIELARSYLQGQPDREALSLHQMIERRVARLPAVCQQVMHLVAVAGLPVPMSVLIRACDDSAASEAVHTLRAVRLVRVVGSRGGYNIDTYHDRVTVIVLASIPAPLLADYHAKLAESFEATRTASAEALASHWSAARRFDKATHYALLAAQEASAAFAFNRAADLYRLALDLGCDSADVWQQYARALGDCGRCAEAAQVFLSVAQRSPQRLKLRLESAAASHLLRSGHVNEATELLQTVLQRVGVRWPSSTPALLSALIVNRARIRLSRWRFQIRTEEEAPSELLDKLDAIYPAQTAFGTFDYLRGAFFSTLALPLALRAGEPERLITAFASEVVYGTMQHGMRGARREQHIRSELDKLAARTSGSYGTAAAALASSLCAYWSGRWEEVSEPALRAERGFHSDVTGRVWETTLVRSVRNTVSLHTGRIMELQAELPVLAAEARSRNDSYTHLDVARSLVTIRLARDDLTTAQQDLTELEHFLSRLPFISLNHLLMSTVVAVRLYADDVEDARHQLQVRWAECRRNGLSRFPLLRCMVLGMQADCVFSDGTLSGSERGLELLRLAKQLDAEAIAWAPAAASSVRARAHELHCDPFSERLELRNACEGYGARGMLLPAALAELRLGQLMIGSEAATTCARAKQTLEQCGVAAPERWRKLAHSVY